MNLRFTSSIILLFLFIFSSCDSSSDEQIEQEIQTNEDDSVSQDETNPIVEVQGLGDLIESRQTIEVSIQDESAVSTKIELNGQEIFTFSNKDFDFILNPYDVPVGKAIIQIVVEDDFGNITELDYEVEIKHFLMDFKLGVGEASNFESIWIFFNDLEGNLLSVKQVELGSNIIYTDEVFDGEAIFYTVSKYLVNNLGQSENLRNTTYNIEPAQTRYELSVFPTFDLSNSLQIDINRNEPDNGFSAFSAKGTGYDTFTFGGGGFTTIVGVRYDNPKDIFLRTDVIGGGPELYDGKKEGYVYKKIEPDLSISTLELDEDDLLPAEEYIQLNVPQHRPGSFNFTRVGYENQEDVINNVRHIIMGVQEPNDQYRDYIDLPILKELEIYSNTINYFTDDINYFSYLFGNQINIEIPNWTSKYRLENGHIFLTASGDADYHSARLYKEEFMSPNVRRNFIWDYRTFKGIADEERALVLELPQEIKDSFQDSFYSNSQDLELTSVSAFDFEDFESYEQLLKWLAVLQETKISLDKQGYRSVSFLPSVNTTGKSKAKPAQDPVRLQQ